jgi:excisionase family DNA binding protein
METQKQTQVSPWLTTKEAQVYLNVGRTTLYKWAQKGIIKVYKIGSFNRFKRSELDEALKPVKPLA